MRNFLFDLQRFQSSAAKYLSAGNDKYTVDSSMFDNPIYDTVYALGGNDTIKVKSGSYGDVTVYGGAGNDSLVTEEASTLLEGNEDDDTITAWNANSSTLDGGAGDDVIENRVSYSGYDAKKLIIKGGAGADKIYSQGYQATIDGGNDNDEITSSGSNSSINGGAGNDKLTLEDGSSLSIRGGAGNDTIYVNNIAANLYQYESGDGNNTIVGVNSGDTLKITSEPLTDGTFILKTDSKIAGNLYSATIDKNKNFVFKTKDGAVSFKDAEKAVIQVVDSSGMMFKFSNSSNGPGINYTNGTSKATIKGLDGNDTIVNSLGVENVSINTGAGDDSVYVDIKSYYSTINGGAGNDSITNDSATVTVYAGEGNDSLINSGSNSLIEGESGKDTIINKSLAFYNTLRGGADEDVIRIESDNELLFIVADGGSGNDSIKNDSQKATLFGGDGNDTITNTGRGSSINGGAGNDSITFENGSSLSIRGGKGDDTIYAKDNLSNLYQYSLGDGNDTIIGITDNLNYYGTNLNAFDTLAIYSTQFHDDFIVKVGSKIAGNTYTSSVVGNDLVFDIGSGAVTFKNSGKAGVNVIENDSTDFKIRIFNTANGAGVYYTNDHEGAIIHGLRGNDTIKDIYDTSKARKTDNIQVFGFDGDDLIENDNSFYAALDGGDGDDTIKNSCTGAKIYTGNGGNFVSNLGGQALITGGDGKDTVSTGALSVTIKSGAGDDSIVNRVSDFRETNNGHCSIDAGDGNDYIYHSYNVVSDKNTLISDGDESTLYGGAGNDTIYNDGNYNTIIGGKGDDSIVLNSLHNLIEYADGDGNDTILGFNINNTLLIDGDYSSVRSSNGSDIIVTVGNGKITLLDGKGTIVKGSFTLPEDTTPPDTTPPDTTPPDTTPPDTTPPDTTPTALNRTNTIASTLITGTKLDDTIENYASNVTINGAGGADAITNLYIEKYDANGNFEEVLGNGDYASINGGDDDDYISNYGARATIRGGAGADTINNDGIIRVDDSDSSVVAVVDEFLIDGGAGNDNIWNINDGATLLGGTNDDYITNSGDNVSIDGGTGNDYISNLQGDNLTITGGAGNDTIFNSGYTAVGKNMLIKYKSGDGDDLIYGDETSSLQIGNGTTDTYSKEKSGDDVIVTVGKGKVTLKGAATTVFTILGKEEQTLKSTIYDNNSAKKVTLASGIEVGDASSRTTAIRLVGNTLDNSIFGGNGKDTLYGKDGDDYLVGNTGADKLYGQNDDDTLHGGDGNDTLTGGAGNDLFVYTAGNDVIADYAAGEKISVNAAITASSVKGSDATFTIGGNTLKVTKGKGQEIIFVDADGNERTIIGGAYLANDSSNAKSTLAAWREVGDASARTTAIKIVGNALDNSIFGGNGKDTLYGKDGDDYLVGNAGADKLYGQNGDDTLDGGDGNDTLTGGAGKDLFIYTAGNDVIADYAAGEKISVNAAITASSVKGSDATFTIGGNTLKVTKGKGKEIVFIDADGNERTIIGGAYLANDSSNAKSTLASWREVADATARTTAINITGNALDNTILGGSGKDTLYGKDGADYLVGNAGNDKLYGQNDDDTLWGGLGNDTLWGGAGADVFIYNAGEGKDVISGFDNNDLLQISGKWTAAYNKSANTIAFKVGSTASAITLKNFTATTFNVSGTAYQIKNDSFVKK